MKTSIVAILGCIIPEPFAIPPMRHSFPSISKETATCFICVSVVIIPSAAASLLFSARPPTSAGIPEAKGAISIGRPITPVEAITISSGVSPSASAASLLTLFAISMPSALQVLAFPLLQITACAFPSFKCSFVTVMGAPFTRFVV